MPCSHIWKVKFNNFKGFAMGYTGGRWDDRVSSLGLVIQKPAIFRHWHA